MKPQTLTNGRTIVKRMENFENWCAWRYWLHRETGRTVFLDKMCVWGDWPPETMQLAQTVCQVIMEARRAIGYTELGVSDPAQPWDRWSFGERDELTRKHREDLFWVPALPEPRSHTSRKAGAYKTKTHLELDAWIESEAAKKPFRKGMPLPKLFRTPHRSGKFKPGESEQEPQPLPFVETPPELKRARAEALARRLGETYSEKANS